MTYRLSGCGRLITFYLWKLNYYTGRKLRMKLIEEPIIEDDNLIYRQWLFLFDVKKRSSVYG